MTRKRSTMLFAVALSALAFAALPAMASAAGGVEIDNAAGRSFSGTFGTATLTKSGSTTTIACSGENHLAGAFTTNSTGSIHLLFTNCTSSSLECHNVIPANKEITAGPYEFHLGWATTSNGTQDPGILITNPTVEYTCFGIPIHVRGNGFVGLITAPACNQTSNSLTVNFASSATGVQEVKTFDFETNEGNPTEYSAEERIGAGTYSAFSYDMRWTQSFASGAEGTLTCG